MRALVRPERYDFATEIERGAISEMAEPTLKALGEHYGHHQDHVSGGWPSVASPKSAVLPNTSLTASASPGWLSAMSRISVAKGRFQRQTSAARYFLML